jgi:hypothetical protein
MLLPSFLSQISPRDAALSLVIRFPALQTATFRVVPWRPEDAMTDFTRPDAFSGDSNQGLQKWVFQCQPAGFVNNEPRAAWNETRLRICSRLIPGCDLCECITDSV